MFSLPSSGAQGDRPALRRPWLYLGYFYLEDSWVDRLICDVARGSISSSSQNFNSEEDMSSYPAEDLVYSDLMILEISINILIFFNPYVYLFGKFEVKSV